MKLDRQSHYSCLTTAIAIYMQYSSNAGLTHSCTWLLTADSCCKLSTFSVILCWLLGCCQLRTCALLTVGQSSDVWLTIVLLIVFVAYWMWLWLMTCLSEAEWPQSYTRTHERVPPQQSSGGPGRMIVAGSADAPLALQHYPDACTRQELVTTTEEQSLMGRAGTNVLLGRVTE